MTKYLVFEEFDTNFNKRKIQVDGITMSVEDFVKKISDDLGDTAKKKEHNSVRITFLLVHLMSWIFQLGYSNQ